jgi:hypothetical protein
MSRWVRCLCLKSSSPVRQHRSIANEPRRARMHKLVADRSSSVGSRPDPLGGGTNHGRLPVWQAVWRNRPLMHGGLRRHSLCPTSPNTSYFPPQPPQTLAFSFSTTADLQINPTPNPHHQNEFPLPPRRHHQRLLRRLRGSLPRSHALQKCRRRRHRRGSRPRRPNRPQGCRQRCCCWRLFRSDRRYRLRCQEPQERRRHGCRGLWSPGHGRTGGAYRAGSGGCWVWEFGAGCRLVRAFPGSSTRGVGGVWLTPWSYRNNSRGRSGGDWKCRWWERVCDAAERRDGGVWRGGGGGCRTGGWGGGGGWRGGDGLV